MKKIFSLLLSFIMLISIVSLVDFSAFAASKLPATSITSLSAKDNGFTVKWKKKTKITGYQIQYSTSSKFSMKNTKIVKIKKAKTASKKIADLKSSKKYYVRIRTYKGKKYSSWSKKKCIIVENSHCTNNNNHSIKCGNMGKWFSSRDEIDKYWVEIDNYYFKQYQTGKITYEEYCKKSPYGYESWSCSYCGKWTGNFKYDEDSDTTTHKHTWNSGKVTKKATCTSTGIKTYTCTSCKATKTSTIPALGHNYNKTVIKPTCTQSGYTKYVCSRCNDTYKSDYQSAIGHKYSYTSNGDKTHTVICTNNCGIKYTENCSLQYNGEYYVCAYCKTNYENIEISENDTTIHTHIWDAGKITTAPTCTTTGIKTYTCMSCGATKNENVDKIEHDYDCETNQATCTEDGYTKYTCKYCGYSYQYITEYAIGHIYEYISNGDGTHYQHCSRCGYKTMNQECIKINNGSDYVCRYCDYVFPQRVTTTIESNSTETTSKKDDESTKVSLTDTSNTSASETTVHTHTWDAGKITTAPTCTTTGIKTYTCTSCGATRNENVDKTEHYFNKTVIPATSVNEGYTIYECNNCHYSYITDYTKKLEEPQTSSKNNITTAATTKPSITKEQRTYESIEKTSYKKVANTKPKNTSIKKLKKSKKAIVVNWKKVSGIKGYQIQVATDKKLKKNAKTVVVKKQKTTTATIKKLKSKKKYYVRIRTYKITNNKKVYSSWSKVKSVVTK